MDMTGIDIGKMTDSEVTCFLLRIIQSGNFSDDVFDELAEDFA